MLGFELPVVIKYSLTRANPGGWMPINGIMDMTIFNTNCIADVALPLSTSQHSSLAKSMSLNFGSCQLLYSTLTRANPGGRMPMGSSKPRFVTPTALQMLHGHYQPVLSILDWVKARHW